MSKRIANNYPKAPKDFWPTPEKAVEPLLKVLPEGTPFIEPCAGDGALVRHLSKAGLCCAGASDVAPRAPGIANLDACLIGPGSELLITNPPFSWELLHPLLVSWMAAGRKCWLLLPWDILANQYWEEFAAHTGRVQAIGRIKWIEDTKSASTDNFVWVYLDPSARFNFLGERVRPVRISTSGAEVRAKPEARLKADQARRASSSEERP